MSALVELSLRDVLTNSHWRAGLGDPDKENQGWAVHGVGVTKVLYAVRSLIAPVVNSRAVDWDYIIYGHPDCLETQGAAIQLRKGKLRKIRLQPNSTVIVVEKLIACLEVACDSNVWVRCVCFGLNNPLFTVLCLMCPINASFFSLNFPSFKVFPPSLQTLRWPRNIWSKHGLWAFYSSVGRSGKCLRNKTNLRQRQMRKGSRHKRWNGQVEKVIGRYLNRGGEQIV